MYAVTELRRRLVASGCLTKPIPEKIKTVLRPVPEKAQGGAQKHEVLPGRGGFHVELAFGGCLVQRTDDAACIIGNGASLVEGLIHSFGVNTVTAYLLQQIQLLPHRHRHGLPPWSPTRNRPAKPTLFVGHRRSSYYSARGMDALSPHAVRIELQEASIPKKVDPLQSIQVSVPQQVHHTVQSTNPSRSRFPDPHSLHLFGSGIYNQLLVDLEVDRLCKRGFAEAAWSR